MIEYGDNLHIRECQEMVMIMCLYDFMFHSYKMFQRVGKWDKRNDPIGMFAEPESNQTWPSSTDQAELNRASAII